MKPEISAPPGIAEITVSHTFDAPIDVVFKTWTDPRLIPQWWGPARVVNTVDYMEVRSGGMWRIVQREASGQQHAFHGVYHAVEAPRRIVSTFEYEGAPGQVSLDTATFEAQDGHTRYTGRSTFQSVADRDAMWAAGCEAGITETMQRFEALLRQRK